MRIFAQEEYGIRCLLRLTAAWPDSKPVTIQEIAAAEGLSTNYTAKILRALREGGLVTSTRGASGGYSLSRSPAELTVWDAVVVLGGPLFDDDFCSAHPGQHDGCVHWTDCSVRALWRWLGDGLQEAMSQVTLRDLSEGEHPLRQRLDTLPPLGHAALPVMPQALRRTTP